mgnify:CR=1 FL=1
MDRLFSFMSFNNFNNFNYTKYKNILQFIPYSSKAINEYKYDVNNELLKSIKEFCVKNQETKFIVSLSGGVDSMVLISIIHYLLGDYEFKNVKHSGHRFSWFNQNDRDEFEFECNNVPVKFNLSWYYPEKIRTKCAIKEHT